MVVSVLMKKCARNQRCKGVAYISVLMRKGGAHRRLQKVTTDLSLKNDQALGGEGKR